MQLNPEFEANVIQPSKKAFWLKIVDNHQTS